MALQLMKIMSWDKSQFRWFLMTAKLKILVIDLGDSDHSFLDTRTSDIMNVSNNGSKVSRCSLSSSNLCNIEAAPLL